MRMRGGSLRRGVRLVAVLGAIVFAWATMFPANGAEALSVIRTNFVILDSFTDFTKDEILVGSAHDVFVGKVTGKLGYVVKQPMIFPYTRYAVQVVHSIKGAQHGQLEVDQLGGLKGNEYFQMRTDTPEGYPELTVGATYTFAVRSMAADDPMQRLISHANGHSLISTNATASFAELEALARTAPRVQKLAEAYKNEVVPEMFERDARNLYRDKVAADAKAAEEQLKKPL